MNKNSRKVDNEEKESIILTLLGDRRNLQNSQIAMIYNEVAMQMGWKAITESAIAVWREKYELESYAGRYGANISKLMWGSTPALAGLLPPL